MIKINAFSKIVVTNALYFVLDHLSIPTRPAANHGSGIGMSITFHDTQICQISFHNNKYWQFTAHEKTLYHPPPRHSLISHSMPKIRELYATPTYQIVKSRRLSIV